MEKQPTIKILVGYHEPASLIQSEVFVPIHLGRALVKEENPKSENLRWLKKSMIGDDTGDNISHLNKCYAELTGIYWAWKNYKKLGNPDYIGFFHYRRLMLFEDRCSLQEALSTSAILRRIRDTDVCLLEKVGAYSKISKRYMESIRAQYNEIHQSVDCEILEGVIKNKYPEMLPALHTIYDSEKISWKNIFVMKRDLFMEYCSFLFELMKEVEKLSHWRSHDKTELRVVGFLSEIVLNVWFLHQERIGKNYKIEYLRQFSYEKGRWNKFVPYGKKKRGVFTIEHSKEEEAIRLGSFPIIKIKKSPQGKTCSFLGIFHINRGVPPSKPLIPRTTRNILLCFDNKYYPYSYVLLNSIFNHNQSSKFCIHIFYNNLKEEAQNAISNWIESKGHDLRFYQIRRSEFSFCPIKRKDKVSIETYFRLFAADKLPPEVDKVLYMDIDTLCMGSLTDLYDCDMEKYPLMATYGGAPDERKKNLGLSVGDNYYQAGVLMMNLAYWRKNNCYDGIRRYIEDHKRHLERWDQDAINGFFKGKIKYLPLKYNAYEICFEEKVLFPNRAVVLEHLLAQRLAAFKSPVIVHFTGFDVRKPWWRNSKADTRRRRWWLEQIKGTPLEGKELKSYRPSVGELLRDFIQKWKSFKQSGIKAIDYAAIEKRCYTTSLFAQDIRSLHKQTFAKYKDIYTGKDVVVVGCGPTLNCYRMIPEAAHIGVNRAFLSENVELDYLFMQDFVNIREVISAACEYRKGKCTKFFGLFPVIKHPMHIPDCWAEKAGALRYYVNETKELNAEEIFRDIESFPLAHFWAACFQALHFAFHTNPRRIYLVGLDCNFSGYFNKQAQRLGADKHLVTWKENVLHTSFMESGYFKFLNFQKIYYPQTEIISINPVRLRGLYKDVYTEEYIKEHPEIKDYTLLKDYLSQS